MRYFTVEEALAALEEVRPLVERMATEASSLASARAALDGLRRKAAGNGGGIDAGSAAASASTLERAAEAVRELLLRLEELGVQVKDVDRGLVDFPAVHPQTGETVLLCWHLGEPTIAYWHGADEGYAGRKPLPF